MIRTLPQLLLVGGSLAAGGVALYLIEYLYQHRAKPGASWFMGNISAVAVFCVAYGLGLLVFDPLVRAVLESVAFVALIFMGPFFVAFSLEYTGRGGLIRSPLFGLVFGVPLVTGALVATNPLHGLVWRNFELAPALGAATVQYTLQPWGLLAVLVSVLTGGIGSLVLIDAIVNYGQLYRREATAVILSTVPVITGVLLWLFGVGPVPQLHLTSVLMLGHLACDGYAFVGTHMFQTSPATQRAAERSAVDELNEPLLVLDDQARVVNLNDSAETLFDVGTDAPFPLSVTAVTGVDRDAMVDSGELQHGGRRFAVSVTALTDQPGSPVGELLVLYDITAQRRRQQQLSVLNRVLRHNLRNEMTVIRGRAEAIRADPPADPGPHADSIVEAGDRLLSIVGNVRDVERVLESADRRTEVDLAAVARETCADIRDQHPRADIRIRASLSDTTVSTNPAALQLALRNIVENAVTHSAAAEPQVTVSLGEADGETDAYRLAVEDDNTEIADIEQLSLQSAEEQPLQHGRGVGLWTANRCVTALGGELTVTYDDGNTVALTFPRTR